MTTGSYFQPIFNHISRDDIEFITFIIIILGWAFSLLWKSCRILYFKILINIRIFIKKLPHKFLSIFPYRLVNINKYKKLSEYKDIIIKITMSMNQYATTYFYWNIIPDGEKSEEFDSLQETKHDILSKHPNIDIIEETQEKSGHFPKRFLRCKNI